jgi:hypothetical protein
LVSVLVLVLYLYLFVCFLEVSHSLDKPRTLQRKKAFFEIVCYGLFASFFLTWPECAVAEPARGR